MEALALFSHLLHYVLAVVAVYLCVTLYRRHRQCGWLLVSAVFLEPFVLMLMRAVRGRPLLRYSTSGPAVDGADQLTYNVDFPVLYILAVVGLFMLVREVRRE
jgi:hypothetical protein